MGQDAYECRRELFIGGYCKLAVSSDGSRIAVCRRPEITTMYSLCAETGNLLHVVVLTDYTVLIFLPYNRDSILLNSLSPTGPRLLSVYNVVTGKYTWERGTKCYAVAVQRPTFTVLMCVVVW
jgi:hypothetical protein